MIALVPSLCFGCITLMVPLIGGTVRQQILGQVSGGFVTGAVATALFLDPHFTWSGIAIAFTSGMICTWGIALQLYSFRVVGVSRTMPVSTGLQLALTALAGVVIFGEWATRPALITGLIAMVTIALGISLTTVTDRRTATPTLDPSAFAAPEVGPTPDSVVRGPRATANIVSRSAMIAGLGINIVSAFLLVVYIVMIRLANLDFADFILPQAAGMVVGALIFGLAWPGDHSASLFAPITAAQMLPGLIWGVGVFVMQLSSQRVGVATGFTLSQLGVVISTFGGIILLGERKTKRELRAAIIGCVLVVLGAILIGVAKGLDLG